MSDSTARAAPGPAPEDDADRREPREGDRREAGEGDRRDPRDDGGIPDLLKRAVSSGMKTFLKSEENIRHLANEIWTNERVGQVGAAIGNMREEVAKVLSREIARYLERMNLTEEMVKLLTAISLEIKTEIRFIPNDKRLVKPDVTGSVKVKRP